MALNLPLKDPESFGWQALCLLGVIARFRSWGVFKTQDLGNLGNLGNLLKLRKFWGTLEIGEFLEIWVSRVSLALP